MMPEKYRDNAALQQSGELALSTQKPAAWRHDCQCGMPGQPGCPIISELGVVTFPSTVFGDKAGSYDVRGG
jgi:hypothetical protein